MGREEVARAPAPGEPGLRYGGASGDDRRYFGRSSGHGSVEEGVEVVLAPEGSGHTVLPSNESKIADADQNVFRSSTASSRGRPRAPRAPSYGAPHPSDGSGSFGYGNPPPHGGEYPAHSTSAPSYNQSGSFDDGYHHHYSPQVQYHQTGGYHAEDINVISPSHGSHKADTPPRGNRPPRHPPMNRHAPPPGYYHYPPTSPVSRQGDAPPVNREGRYPSTHRSDSYHPDDGTWNAFPHSTDPRGQPPVVAESSFDSEHHTSPYSSYPPTPAVGQGALGAPPTPTGSYDAHQQFYGTASWGSFDSQLPVPPAPQFDDQRYYSYPPAPESPYGAYGAPYYPEAYPSYAHTPHEEREHGMYGSHYEAGAPHVTPVDQRNSSGGRGGVDSNGTQLPDAAHEVPFEVTDPPSEPVVPSSSIPSCHSVAELNRDDVLCGRGGGTNSQIGNRRFRQLVQDFQPIYLLARRKEKPRIARSIVMIIRGRGGRFLKKDEDTGMLYEVGDLKAEAKTSQALREGLDVRATKSAEKTSGKKKKKKDGTDEETDSVQGKETEDKSKADEVKGAGKAVKENEPEAVDSPKQGPQSKTSNETPKRGEAGESTPQLKTPPSRESATPRAGVARAMRDRTPSPPPSLPHLQVGPRAGYTQPHSPEALQFRKRRRMRSGEGCIPFEDKLFPDFCPPRADLCRTASPDAEEDAMHAGIPQRRNSSRDVDETEFLPPPGCADIAMMMMTGATGGFCFQPKWRR